MQLIEALKLRSKLLFLFILITLGLITITIMGRMHIETMKKNIDNVYFGSLVPVTELNEIVQTYNNRLFNTIYQSKRQEITPTQTTHEIRSDLQYIENKWKSYKGHFKRDDEKKYVLYASSEIQNINNYFHKIYRVTKNGRDLKDLNINILEKKISFINAVLEKLINYEITIASYERKIFLYNYTQSKMQLGLILVFIMLTILTISLYVFRSIQKDQTQLELTTKKLKKANKKLENVSYTDSLTGLHNRRYFNLVYEREVKRAKRSISYITFMMLDIDFFKQYNDTYGHVEGDYALKSVSKILQDTLKRPSDYVFRLGGEEFGVLVTDTDESNSAKLARDICDAIRGREIKHEKSTVNEFVTISIGVVCCMADDALQDELLISRADEMLYKAKETGRNRYVITSNVSAALPKAHADEDVISA